MTAEKRNRAGMQAARVHLLLLAVFSLLHLIPYAAGSEWASPLPPFLPLLPISLQITGGLVVLVGILYCLLTGLVYFICWRMSYRPAWMIAALVMFVQDTATMLLFTAEWDLGGVIRAVLHGWVLCWLLLGSVVVIREGRKQAGRDRNG